MPEVDPIDDGFDGGDPKPTEGGAAAPETSTIQELRKAYERAERREAALQKQLEQANAQLGEYTSKEREQQIATIFGEVGLNPVHGELFKKVNPELDAEKITADAVKEFASTYQLPTSEGQVPDAPEKRPAGYTPPPTTGTPAPSSKLGPDEIDKMLRDGDLDAVGKAFRDGRVEKSEAPWPMHVGRS